MSEFATLMSEYAKVSDEIDMIHLTKVIDHLFDWLKDTHPEKYKKFITKVKLSNKHIPWDREQAECAVRKMKNKDGTEGEHWTFEQTTEVMEKKGIECNPAKWYYVMNAVFSDSYSQNFSTETYVQLACDVIHDIDAPEDSVKRVYIAKHF